MRAVLVFLPVLDPLTTEVEIQLLHLGVGGGGGGFPHLPKAASTGPASERRLLALDGPSAGLDPGGASCPACEPLPPAADTQAADQHLQTPSKTPTSLPFLLAAAG